MIDWKRFYLSQVRKVGRAGRWTVNRKSALLKAIEHREITEADALAFFQLTSEELRSWRRHARIGGTAAMRVTRLQAYR